MRRQCGKRSSRGKRCRLTRGISGGGCGGGSAVNGQGRVSLRELAGMSLWFELRGENGMNEELVRWFAAWFINRWDQYALQQRDGSYRLVAAPLSLDLVAAHLAGRCTLGSYVLDAGSRC